MKFVLIYKEVYPDIVDQEWFSECYPVERNNVELCFVPENRYEDLLESHPGISTVFYMPMPFKKDAYDGFIAQVAKEISMHLDMDYDTVYDNVARAFVLQKDMTIVDTWHNNAVIKLRDYVILDIFADAIIINGKRYTHD